MNNHKVLSGSHRWKQGQSHAELDCPDFHLEAEPGPFYEVKPGESDPVRMLSAGLVAICFAVAGFVVWYLIER